MLDKPEVVAVDEERDEEVGHERLDDELAEGGQADVNQADHCAINESHDETFEAGFGPLSPE